MISCYQDPNEKKKKRLPTLESLRAHYHLAHKWQADLRFNLKLDHSGTASQLHHPNRKSCY